MFIDGCSTSVIRALANAKVCEGSELFEVKVPLICPSAAGVPVRREGR
jgi:predicted secreted protein